jgi:hypothetical protein
MVLCASDNEEKMAGIKTGGFVGDDGGMEEYAVEPNI